VCARREGSVRTTAWLWRPGAPEEEGDISVHDELSLAELEGELCAELPTRNLMRRRKVHFIKKSFHRFHSCGGFSSFGHERFSRFDDGFSRFGGTSAFASFGSAANANSTFQSNFNPQIGIGGFGSISSFNQNINSTRQFAAPINFGF
jgi:hypothetical protein